MSSSTDEPSRRHLPFAIIAVSIVAGLIITALFGWWMMTYNALRGEIAAIAEAGEPLKLHQLDDFYPIPDGRNAADIYMRANDVLTRPEQVPVPDELEAELDAIRHRLAAERAREQLRIEGLEVEGHDTNQIIEKAGLPLPSVTLADMLPDEDLARIRDLAADRYAHLSEPQRSAPAAWVTANSDVVDLALEAVAIEAARYPVNYSGGPLPTQPHISTLSYFRRLLMLRAKLALEAGEPDDLVESVIAAIAVARSMNDVPCELHIVYQDHIISATAQVLRAALHRGVPLSESHLAAWQNALSQVGREDQLTRALIQNRATMYAALDEAQVDRRFGTDLWRWATATNVRERTELLVYYRRLIAASRKPPHERITTVRATAQAHLGEAEKWPDAVLHGLNLDVIFKANAALARRHLAMTTLALERYRLAHDRLPDTLDTLVPDYLANVLTDPFDGKPLRYEAEEAGFTIYSIGPNLTDEGETRADQADEGDVVFRVIYGESAGRTGRGTSG